jgi:hypothetical protein
MTNIVYGVYTLGNDYYDQEQLYSLYANQQDAEKIVDELRLLKDEDSDDDELLYVTVSVFPLTVK